MQLYSNHLPLPRYTFIKYICTYRYAYLFTQCYWFAIDEAKYLKFLAYVTNCVMIDKRLIILKGGVWWGKILSTYDVSLSIQFPSIFYVLQHYQRMSCPYVLTIIIDHVGELLRVYWNGVYFHFITCIR